MVPALASTPAVVPLFSGLPGGPELLIILLLFVLIGLGLAIGLGVWVYRDASRRGDDSAALWGAFVAVAFLAGLIPGVVAVGAYLLTRDRTAVGR
jgi:hypothetical protein